MRLLANLYVALFGRRIFYRFNQRLLNLAVRGMGIGHPNSELIDASEERFMRSLRVLGPIQVFDVGGHIGEFAARLSQVCPEASIWSFEPHPRSYSELAKAATASGFTPIQLGLSDAPGKMRLYDYAAVGDQPGSAHASLHAEVFTDIHHGDSVEMEVEVDTVDALLEAKGIEHLTLLKVDAEGHELAVLRGAHKAIAAGQIDVVQFEFNEMNVMSRVFFRDFYAALPGFVFYRMVVDGLAAMGEYRPRSHELFIWQNVVAIRGDFEGRSRLL
jgi:FkbM family methyltransferase